MESYSWLNPFLAVTGVLSAAVTAIATIALWRVTRNLATETKRMVDASSQPHVVATIEPNKWSLRHVDLKVDNTGNATAYDIRVAFEPPLQNAQVRSSEVIPLQQISVLKPSGGVASYLSEYEKVSGKTYTVKVSWRRNPSGERETNSYTLDMRYMRGMTQLGASSPLLQLAGDFRNLKEDFGRLTRGWQSFQMDILTALDRLHRRRQAERRRRVRREQQEMKQGGSDPSERAIEK